MPRSTNLNGESVGDIAARNSGEWAEDEARPDSLTSQLRRLYGAIAEEPIPESITALLRKLKN